MLSLDTMHHIANWNIFKRNLSWFFTSTFIPGSGYSHQSSQIMFPRQWLRDKPISTGVMAGFSQTPEKTAPVSGFPCVPTERPVPGASPHLLPANSRA